MKKINSNLDKFKLMVLEKIKPTWIYLKDYWQHLSERERWIIKFGGIFLLFISVSFIISTATNLEENLTSTLVNTNTAVASSKRLTNQFKDLASITSNNFTEVNVDRIKGDITQLFAIKNPNVAIADKVLYIQIPKAKFELIMLFLDQLRKSYGIFPTRFKITRTLSSGIVNFSATFNIEE